MGKGQDKSSLVENEANAESCLGVKGLKKKNKKKGGKSNEDSESAALGRSEQNESKPGAGDVSSGAKGDDSQVDSVPSIEGSIQDQTPRTKAKKSKKGKAKTPCKVRRCYP